jgi:cyanophycin synthetase
MEFRKIVALRGPNIWAKSPVLEAWIDLGDLKDSPSNEMPGFNERLMSWLPQMIEHECSVGTRGGFFERLRRGTYLAHIMEHVTLELQAQAGSGLGYGRARETNTEGLFRVAFRYEEEGLARACVEAARELCLAAVHDRPYEVKTEIHKLRCIADDLLMGPSTRTMAQAARARGIPVRRLSDGSLLQLGHGAKQHRVHRSATDRTGAVAESISDDKELTKAYLRSAGVPVAKGRLVTSPADAWRAAGEIGMPVVVKPRDCNFGNGVVIGISKREQIEGAYKNAAPQGSGVMVEQLAPGSEHRLLIVAGKLVAATRGNPAVVVGDGKHTISELIESQLNSDPRRGEDSSFPLAKVEFGPTVLLTLKNEGFEPTSVPPAGKSVLIQRNGNLAMDVTDEVHPEVRRHAEMAARVIGLDVAGIDIIADDISRPLEEQSGVVIEVNAGPGLQMHVTPESGKPRPVGEAIVATLFPEGDNGRVPLVAVTGGEDTNAVTKWIARFLSHGGRTVGMACQEGTFVGETRTQTGDCRAAENARSVLLNPLVEAAVFEVSLERIPEEGLGFDRCQVAVLTSIGEGIRLDVAAWDTPQKKVLVHRTVSDVVLPRGAVVFKAGEPLGPLVAEPCDGMAVLFSADGDERALRVHLAAGGKAVFARGGRIVVADTTGEIELPAFPAVELSDALLAAVAAAWALPMTRDQITAVLQAAANR